MQKNNSRLDIINSKNYKKCFMFNKLNKKRRYYFKQLIKKSLKNINIFFFFFKHNLFKF